MKKVSCFVFSPLFLLDPIFSLGWLVLVSRPLFWDFMFLADLLSSPLPFFFSRWSSRSLSSLQLVFCPPVWSLSSRSRPSSLRPKVSCCFLNLLVCSLLFCRLFFWFLLDPLASPIFSFCHLLKSSLSVLSFFSLLFCILFFCRVFS